MRRLVHLPVLLLAAVLALVAVSVADPAGAREVDARRSGGLASTGYILGGTADRIVERDAHGLATLGIDGVAITPDGRDVALPDGQTRHLVATAHDNGLRAELLVHNFSDLTGDFDPAAAAALLRHPHRIRSVTISLAQFVTDHGWDGIQIDFESLAKEDGPGLVRFAEELQNRMPEEKTVSLAMQAATDQRGYRVRGYQLAALADTLDVIALMTYDQHGPSWSAPGPIGGLPWQRDALATLFEVVPASMVDVGVSGYGYTWPKHGTGHTVTIRQARKLVSRDGATARWRAGQGEWTAKLSDGTVLWWSDGDSYELRLDLASELGAHGLALWRLGSADPLP